ncbi:MAG: hypothetical protein M3186_17300 [Actinomycetota bacterium]|nr:hypothetical protein [Actinomycetota bacterium]
MHSPGAVDLAAPAGVDALHQRAMRGETLIIAQSLQRCGFAPHPPRAPKRTVAANPRRQL